MFGAPFLSAQIIPLISISSSLLSNSIELFDSIFVIKCTIILVLKNQFFYYNYIAQKNILRKKIYCAKKYIAQKKNTTQHNKSNVVVNNQQQHLIGDMYVNRENPFVLSNEPVLAPY